MNLIREESKKKRIFPSTMAVEDLNFCTEPGARSLHRRPTITPALVTTGGYSPSAGQVRRPE